MSEQAVLDLAPPESTETTTQETLDLSNPETEKPTEAEDWRSAFKVKEGDQEFVPKTLSRYNSKDDVVKAYIALEKGYSKKVEEFLKTADEDQKQMLRSSLGGSPESAEKYEAPKYKEGEFDFNDSQYTVLKSIAHKGGINQEGFQSMCNELRTQEMEAGKKLTELLTQAWGENLQSNNIAGKTMFARLSPQLQTLVSEQWGTKNPLLNWLMGEVGNQFRSTSPINREEEVISIESKEDLMQQIGNAMQETDYFKDPKKQEHVQDLWVKVGQTKKLNLK